MIGATSQSANMAPQETAGPGKKMQSVGHLAKRAVAAAMEAGIDLPKNAQGMAASAIAKGADPASVFDALVQPEDPVADPVGTAEKTEAPVQDAPPVFVVAAGAIAPRANSGSAWVALRFSVSPGAWRLPSWRTTLRQV